MKIASYNMAQSAISHYERHEKQTFEAVMKAFENLDKYSDYVTPVAEEEDYQEIFEPENDLIDALMAYLDRRRFDDQIVPYISKGSIDDNSVNYNSSAIGIMTFKTSLEVFETETLFFESKGQLLTEDGQNIDFSYDLGMNRAFYQKHSHIMNDGFIDPLVLNLDNKGVDFSDKIIHLDLDLDDQIDTFKMVTSGNGFLVLDKNENNQIDDGSELFGPSSNHGFKELQAYDDDQNLWIDENDLVFKNLKLWSFDEDGKETLIDLKDTNIGAIYLGNIAGQFDFKHEGDTIARITNSSIFLRNDGSASAIHEVLL